MNHSALCVSVIIRAPFSVRMSTSCGLMTCQPSKPGTAVAVPVAVGVGLRVGEAAGVAEETVVGCAAGVLGAQLLEAASTSRLVILTRTKDAALLISPPFNTKGCPA